MIYEHAHVVIDADRSVEFEDAFGRAQKYLRQANGGQLVELVRSADRPGHYLLRVGWVSVEDHTEVFAMSDNGKLFAQAVAGFFTEPPYVVHLEASALSL